jgi:hypothetical protein
MLVGILRGREESFPEAVLARINSMGRGVAAELVRLGGTRAGEAVPYRVILDRISARVPYYETYLRAAAAQGTYCINDLALGGEDEFLARALLGRTGLRIPRCVALPNREYAQDVGGEGLRNLWPIDFAMYLDHVGLPCLLRPAAQGRGGQVQLIGSLEDLLFHYNASGRRTMLLQERVDSDIVIRVLTVGGRVARAVRYDPGSRYAGIQSQEALSGDLIERAEQEALRLSRTLRLDLNAPEFLVRDSELVCVDLASGAPDLDYRFLGDDHFPWIVERVAELAVEKAVSEEASPRAAALRSITERTR